MMSIYGHQCETMEVLLFPSYGIADYATSVLSALRLQARGALRSGCTDYSPVRPEGSEVEGLIRSAGRAL